MCLYHGEKKWDGPRTLHDMMDFGEDRERTFWEREFANYGMRLVCVNELEDVSKFTTELKEVFEIMNHRGDRQEMNQFLEQHEEYKRLDEETAWVIGTVMGVDVFMENHERYKTNGGYNMCTAIREMWNEGKNEGVNLSAAVFRAVKNGLLDDQEIAALCECTVDEVRRIRTVFGI